MNDAIPDVLDFTNSTEFLRSLIQQRRSSNSALGLSQLSKKAGFTSASTLGMIVTGKRRLSLNTAAKLARAVPLQGKQKRYFLELVKFETAEDDQTRSEIQVALSELRGEKKKNFLELSQYRFFSIWYYPVIYAMAGLNDFQMRESEIASKLKRGVKASDVKTALDDLQKLGLIRIQGRSVKQVRNGVATPDSVSDEAARFWIRQYHTHSLRLAEEALSLPSEQREFMGVTLPVPERLMPEVKERLREFRQKMEDFLSASSHEGDVHQLCLLFFPITHSKTQSRSTK